MSNNRYQNNLMQLFCDKELVKICAPMVRYSKLQFRTLVRDYECDLCFTPMILADSFSQSPKARHNEFSTNLSDTPVVVQFAANTVHDFVGAACLVSPYTSGVDLNCGCPQRWAKAQGIGCIMLENPELIFDIVRQCRNHILKPFSISVKMRLLPDLKKTVSTCQQLEHCGISFLTVHGRTANQHSIGAVNLNALKLISESVSCPVVANGGVKHFNDVIEIQDETKCKGVMVANGLLTNPALFSGVNVTPMECIQKWLDICYNSTLDYDSVAAYDVKGTTLKPQFQERNKNLTFQCFHHHLVFMLEKILPKTLRKTFNNLQTFHSVLEFLNDNFNIEPSLFSLEKFKFSDRLLLDYENRDDIYFALKVVKVSNDLECPGYNTDKSDGKFFSSKRICTDNSDICISSLFADD